MDDFYKGSLVFGYLRGLQVIVRDAYEPEISTHLRESGYLPADSKYESFGTMRILPTGIRSFTPRERNDIETLANELDIPFVTPDDSSESIEGKVSSQKDPYLNALVRQHLTL